MLNKGDWASNTSQCKMLVFFYICRDKAGYYYQTCDKIGLPVCEAMVAAADGDFAKAVDLIYPVRYDIIRIGGSGAQVGCYNELSLQCEVQI